MVFKRTVYDMPDHNGCLVVVERKGVMHGRMIERDVCTQMLDAYASITPSGEDPEAEYLEPDFLFDLSSDAAGP
jgi:hypothetical protein